MRGSREIALIVVQRVRWRRLLAAKSAVARKMTNGSIFYLVRGQASHEAAQNYREKYLRQDDVCRNNQCRSMALLRTESKNRDDPVLPIIRQKFAWRSSSCVGSKRGVALAGCLERIQ